MEYAFLLSSGSLLYHSNTMVSGYGNHSVRFEVAERVLVCLHYSSGLEDGWISFQAEAVRHYDLGGATFV